MTPAAHEGSEGEPAVAPAPAAASSEGGGSSVVPAAEEQTLAEWLAQGPYTLALSSSFFGYYAHAGALQARPQPQLRRGRSARTGLPCVSAARAAAAARPRLARSPPAAAAVARSQRARLYSAQAYRRCLPRRVAPLPRVLTLPLRAPAGA
jgi:hypothetical protein